MRLSAPIYHLKRRAKQLARDKEIPLNKALNSIAKQEGFPSWSLLSAQASSNSHPAELLSQINPGDLVLLGARPGHGKTMMGLKLVLEAIKAGQRGVFFTLEYNEKEALERIQSIGGKQIALDHDFQIDASDEISADYVIDRLSTAPYGTIAVIDYLQIMDQKRTKPELSEQITALKIFAKKSGVIFIFISQIDRSFELSEKLLPELQDIRLPNPLDLQLFNKSCFLNNGKMQINILN